MRAGWVLLLGVVLLPAAQAALTVRSVQDPPALRVGELGALNLTVDIECKSLLLRTDPLKPAAAVPLHIDPWHTPAAVSVGGAYDLSVPVDACLAGGDQVTMHPWFTAGIDNSVAAGAQQVLFTNVSLAASAADVARAPAVGHVSAAPFLLAEVTSGEKAKACTCHQLNFTITVSNQGNAATTFRFGVGQAPTQGTVTYPDPVVLAAHQVAGVHSATVQVALVEPADARWESQAFQIRITLDGGPGATPREYPVSFLGTYIVPKQSPSLGAPWIVVGVLAFAAFLVRRRA